MSEGSTKSTLFDRVLAKFIIGRAKDDGLEREAAQGLITGHMLSTDSNKPLDALADPVGGLLRTESRKVYKTAQKLKKNVGQVDISARGQGSRIQTVAEIVDHQVSEDIHNSLPEVKARNILQQIQDEIIKKNGW